MRLLLLITLLITTLTYCKGQATDEQNIRAVMDKQVSEWNNRNIPAFMET